MEREEDRAERPPGVSAVDKWQFQLEPAAKGMRVDRRKKAGPGSDCLWSGRKDKPSRELVGPGAEPRKDLKKKQGSEKPRQRRGLERDCETHLCQGPWERKQPQRCALAISVDMRVFCTVPRADRSWPWREKWLRTPSKEDAKSPPSVQSRVP